MFNRILVPLDGSPRAEKAIPVAARIARASGGTVRLMQVVTLPIDNNPYLAGSYLARPIDFNGQVMEQDINRATTYLERLANSAQLAGITIEIEVPVGMPAPVILSAVYAQQVDLVVMCSHGDTGFRRWILGSVAQKVTRHSPVPVLVLREDGLVPAGGKATRILVALDGSALAESVLAPAAQLSIALSAPAPGALHLIRVLRRLVREGDRHADSAIEAAERRAAADVQGYLDAAAHRLCTGELARLNFSVTSSLVFDSNVPGTLIDIAEKGEHLGDGIENWCDVIALATHGRGGPQRWLMGSVTERVLGFTGLPLLIVRPALADAEQEVARKAVSETQGWVGLL